MQNLNLNDEQYGFLKTEPQLKNLLYLTMGGSHAYGLNNQHSDIDIRGVTFPTIENIIGMSEYEQFVDENTDTVIYTFAKFIKLISQCNPNVIEMLGTKKEHILFINAYGQQLRNMTPYFLSQRAYYSFSGYAIAQLRRLQNALAHDSYPDAEKVKHLEKTLQHMLGHLYEKYQVYSESEVKIYGNKSEDDVNKMELFIDMDLRKFPLRKYAGMMSEINDVMKNYDKLNHRNKKKDELHLLKHAMHLIRLFKMGQEILSGKGVNTYRENDKNLLLDIRNGKYSYEEIFEMAKIEEKEMEYAYNNSTLPQFFNKKVVEEFVIDINRQFINKQA